MLDEHCDKMERTIDQRKVKASKSKPFTGKTPPGDKNQVLRHKSASTMWKMLIILKKENNLKYSSLLTKS